MPIPCWFGYHDWEIIRIERKTTICYAITKDHDDLFNFRYPNDTVEQKVCLKCNKVVNEIDEFKHQILARIERQQSRQKLAIKILNESK